MVSLVQDKVTLRLRLWPRNELETALGELIVSRSGFMAARTNRPRAFARTHGNLNALVVGTEAGLVVDESGKTVATI
jgi:hypothetical protein